MMEESLESMLHWNFKMRLIFVIFMSCMSLYAYNINNSILKIHASIMPKIFLLAHGYENNIQNNTITITIAHNQTNQINARYLKNEILSKYKKLSSYDIEVKIIKYKDIISCNKSTNILYLLPSNNKDLKRAVKVARGYHALTFSYAIDDLQNNAMISMNIGKSVKPILNLEAIKESNLSFKPVLLSISKIYINNIK